MRQIQLQQIHKEYGDAVILDDISFSVSYGERIGIVGPNGCGKSTLLGILAGRVPADAGTVWMSKKTSLQLLEQDHFAAAPEYGLSAGEWTKQELGRILNDQANLLLLDEPTNNLDKAGIEKFLYQLEKYEGTVLMVSHDRYVLDQSVQKIVEIEQGKTLIYEGNYSSYREEKQHRREAQMHHYEENRKQQKQLDAAIRQVRNWSEKAHRDSTKSDPSGLKFGVKEQKRAKAKRMDRQVKSNIRRLEKMREEGTRRPEDEVRVRFQVKNSSKGGHRQLEVTGLAKAFGEHMLFENSDFYIARGERVALCGPNGCGKSTLVQIITGEISADRGTVWISPGSEPYVLHQTFTKLPGAKRSDKFLEEQIGEFGGLERTILHNLGLTKRHLLQKIDDLSFGEQMKLKLAQPVLEGRDFLILDEPTNHLDLSAREQLEETLQEYNGTLLIVSHDRYFLERVCDKALVIEEQQIRRLEYLPVKNI